MKSVLPTVLSKGLAYAVEAFGCYWPLADIDNERRHVRFRRRSRRSRLPRRGLQLTPTGHPLAAWRDRQ
jgi:hypothetical protein